MRSLRAPRTMVATAVASALLSACGGGSARYSAGGVTFEYPKAWHTVFSATPSPGPTGSTSRVGIGIGERDLVVLVTNQLPAPVTADSFKQTEDGLVTSLTQGAQRQGGSVAGPSAVQVGGLEGFSLTISNLQVNGTTVSSRLVVVLHGDTEYFLNCQSTSEHEAEIAKGCDQIVGSFRFA